MKDFKAFVLRGNVVDLAIGVVIGAAFGAIVTSIVNDLITPLISALNIPDFSSAIWHVGDDPSPAGDVKYGLVINAVISFLVIAAVVFFLVVKPLNRLMGRDKEPDPTHRECPHCLTSIPIAATICAACTREVAAPPRSRAKAKR